MLPRMIRPVGVLLLVLLPVAIFWVILSYFDPTRIVADKSQTTPRWVEDGRRYGTCTEAMSGTRVPNRPVAVDEVRAARIGAGVIESQTNLYTIAGRNVTVFPPVLVERLFPDGQSHLAWVYGQGSITDQYAMIAWAEFVYIDAATGEPLLLIKDMFAGDPNFTCSQLFLSEYLGKRITLYLGGTLVTGLYLLIVGGVALFRRRRSRRQAQSQKIAGG